MAYFWNRQNPSQQPNQPATSYLPSTMFGTMPPLFVAQVAAHVHNTVPFFILPIMSIDHERNLIFTYWYVVICPRSNYHIPTRVNSEGRSNSSGGNLMVSREDDTLLLSYVLEESINQENPSPPDGLSEKIIARNLKTRDCTMVRHSDGDDEICVVCQDSLCQENDKIGTLDCGHEYHQECIRKWLIQRNFCPVCKAAAIHVD